MAGDLYEKYRPKNLPIVYTYRKFKWDQFFIGLFGALAIFGVLMKLWEVPFWGLITSEQGDFIYKIFMPIGFLGECAVFIIMGFMKGEGVIEVYPEEMEDIDEQEAEDHHSLPGAPTGGIVVNMELPESLKELIEEKVANQIDGKLADITNLLVEDVEKTRNLLTETNEVNARIQDIAISLADFSDKLKAASESLAPFEGLSTGNISQNAATVSDRLESAGSELGNFEEEMRKLASRFKRFNSANN